MIHHSWRQYHNEIHYRALQCIIELRSAGSQLEIRDNGLKHRVLFTLDDHYYQDLPCLAKIRNIQFG